MLDGAARLGPLFAGAARHGMPALAMTDHGNLYGAHDFGEVTRGLAERFPAGVPGSHSAQATYELDVICQMGFPGYFLVVADLCRHAVHVKLVNGSRATLLRLGPPRVEPSSALMAHRKALLGPAAVGA